MQTYKLMEINIPGAKRKATLSIDHDVAQAIRKIARGEGRAKELTDVVRDMVSAYLASAHPDWTVDK